MSVLTKVRNRIASWVSTTESSVSMIPVGRGKSLQAHPAQKSDHSLLFAPEPMLVPLMVQFAMNNWVYAAVNIIATRAAGSDFMVKTRDGMIRIDDHPLLSLVGKFGRPNFEQDSFEFWEKHFQNLILAGNSFWLWDDEKRGIPSELHLLEPEHMRIVPGRDKTVERYEYWRNGPPVKYHPDEITHFRRANPFNRYWGLSALQAIYWTVIADNHMLKWNNQFFDDELGIPAGILIVPAGTSDAELARIKAEFLAVHGEQRRVAFIKADAGKSVWLDAGLKPKDYDFTKGRGLNRQSVYEALDLPLSFMSETSTEALAIVGERHLGESIHTWHTRTERKLNVDGLDLFSRAAQLQTVFADIRKDSVDWRREKDRVLTWVQMLSLDELRAREFDLPPLGDGEVPLSLLKLESGDVNE